MRLRDTFVGERFFPVFTRDHDGRHRDSPYDLAREDGQLYVILDTGAVGNLCGDRWAQRVATAAVQNRLRPDQTKLPKPLEVGGVGKGRQKAYWEAICLFVKLFRILK